MCHACKQNSPFQSELVCMLLIDAEADGALDKARKHKKRQLEDTLSLVIKKRRVMVIMPFFLLVRHSFSAVQKIKILVR